jgi:uncharacterized repeat protein (TIGR01451 family)
LTVFLSFKADCQTDFYSQSAIAYFKAAAPSNDLLPDDVNNIIVTDQYKDTKTGITYTYLQQSIDGIPVDGTTSTVVVDQNGKSYSSGHSFYRNLYALRTINSGNSLLPKEAVLKTASGLNIRLSSTLRQMASQKDNYIIFSHENAEDDITARQIYAMDDSGNLKLCWEISMDDPLTPDFWRVNLDAQTGKILSKHNYTIYCRHEPGKFSSSNHECQEKIQDLPVSVNELIDASYLVYELPLDNPNIGSRTQASDNQFPEASPIGWHDNGTTTFNITRGNNVHAYEDSDNGNSSNNNEPSGGTQLKFNFPHSLDLEPTESEDAAITNLFYTNNMSHDLFYLLGFTEVAGNFQDENFGKGGRGNDYINAEGLDGADVGNANFLTRPDGNRGRMQMYLFNSTPSLIKIDQPADLNDLNFETGLANFGPSLKSVDVSGEVAAFNTNPERDETLGCATVISNLSGKIALIDRGTCDFSLKVYNAQQAGAIMAIVCNIEGVDGGTGEELLTMAAGDNADDVNIPSAFMKKSDCDIIRTTIDNGSPVTLSVRERVASGPDFLDACYDNGVIIHEYAHGVSIRLTGGPSNTGCLPDFDDDGNDFPDRGEQMGEGWSDFFGMAFTTRPEDDGVQPRGIGTYLLNETADKKGFRNYPYSTDMNINPLIYNDIKTLSVPHGVGSVWATMLMDMYWKFIELYDFNPDWTNTASGNYKSCFLIMEAMKLQPCRPGFVDGRNAILEADNIHFGGIHAKLIWEVFARRGLGMNADQGSSVDHRDGTEDFSIPPLLIEELKIEKQVSKFVDAGENMEVTIKVINHIPSTQSGVVVADELPEGLVYVDGSSDISPVEMDGTLSFNLGDMDYKEEFTFKYLLNADPDRMSNTLYLDDVDGITTDWTLESKKGSKTWARVTDKALSGDKSWFIAETSQEEVDQRLVSPQISITGVRPVLRFWHQYNIVDGANGGFIELSTDNGNSWKKVEEQLGIRNPYPGELAFSTFAIPSLQGFSGSTNGEWIDSYIDMSPYRNQDVMIRFRFGNEGELVSDGSNPGWYIDEIELLDIQTYNSAACVRSDQDPEERCSSEQVTVVNSGSTTSTTDLQDVKQFSLYPNPVNNTLYINNEIKESGVIIIKSLDGKLMFKQELNNVAYKTNIDVTHWHAGLYIVTMVTQSGLYSDKVEVIH